MGNSSSSGEQEAKEEGEANADMEKLSDKLKLMLTELEKTRGNTKSDTEISGGRTVMRYEKIFLSKAKNTKPAISEAIDAFFAAADSGIDGDSEAAKHSAVNGAKALVDQGVRQVTENRQSESSETKSFEVVFMNNSFCRIDYYLWQQYILADGKGFSFDAMTETSKVARILVCDIAVIPGNMLNAEEITFLLSKALHIPTGQFKKVLEMSAGLAQVTMLTTMVKAIEAKFLDTGMNDTSDLDHVVDIMVKIAEANLRISQAFAGIGHVDAPKNLHMHDETKSYVPGASVLEDPPKVIAPGVLEDPKPN